MARFKNKDLLLSTNEEVLFGDAQEASIKWDGSDLVTDQVLKHDVDGYYATQEFVNDALAGLEWQDSVLSMTTDIPVSPSAGDRYIIPSGASGAWSGSDDSIAEYSTIWVYTTPRAGLAAYVEDEGAYFVYSGSNWVRIGSVIDHGLLGGLADDDHTQYLHIDGSRAIDTLTVTISAHIGENLAVGTVSPEELIHVYKASGAAKILLESGDNSALVRLKGVNSSDWQFGIEQSTGDFLLRDQASNFNPIYIKKDSLSNLQGMILQTQTDLRVLNLLQREIEKQDKEYKPALTPS